MRRVLKARALGLPEGDLSTLERSHDRRAARDLLRTMLRSAASRSGAPELYSGGQIRGFPAPLRRRGGRRRRVCAELTEDDSVNSTYREHGHALARGVPARALMAEMFGKVTGCSRGRGGRCTCSTGRAGSSAATPSAADPLAVGLCARRPMRGHAGRHRVLLRRRRDGRGRVPRGAEPRRPAGGCPCSRAARTTSTRWAPRSPRSTGAPQSRPLRAASYGATLVPVDGMDAVAVNEAARRGRGRAVAAAPGRSSSSCAPTGSARPLDVRPHDRYRAKDEVADWRDRDRSTTGRAGCAPTARSPTRISPRSMPEVVARVTAAVEAAAAGEEEPVEDLTRFVYSDTSTAARASDDRRGRRR